MEHSLWETDSHWDIKETSNLLFSFKVHYCIYTSIGESYVDM